MEKMFTIVENSPTKRYLDLIVVAGCSIFILPYLLFLKVGMSLVGSYSLIHVLYKLMPPYKVVTS